MKVIIYNISQEAKKSIALLNRKKHKITIITDPLTEANIDFAIDKDVIVSNEDHFSEVIMKKILSYGVKYIILRTKEQSTDDILFTSYNGLRILKTKSGDPESEALQIITILDA